MPRVKHKYHYLYKTTNVINEKFYVGMHSTSDLDDGYLGSGLRLRRSIRKYGEQNFKIEILQFFDSRDELAKAEENFVNENFIKDPQCMNLKVGGEGGLDGLCKESLSKIRAGASKSLKARWQTDEYREIQLELKSRLMKERHDKGLVKYDTFSGKNHSVESKNKMREVKLGKYDGEKNSQYDTCWITRDGKNKKIKKDVLNEYLSNGWIKGRVI